MQEDAEARKPSSGAQRTAPKGKSSTLPAYMTEDPRTSTVLFWCGSRIWVRCAWCKGQHHFRFKGYDLDSYDMFCRLPSRSYSFTFPACFEIDEEQGWLVNSYPEDTPEQAIKRAVQLAPKIYSSTLTSLIGPKLVEASTYGRSVKHRQHEVAINLTTPASDEQAILLGNPSSLFLRCPTSGTIKYMVEAATLPAFNEEGTLRTAAILKRGTGYPGVMAISGIGRIDNVPFYVLINQADRFQRVIDLMKYLKYDTLPAPGNTTAGAAFYATHAEKQLIAYFVYKHVITPEDRARVYTFKPRNNGHNVSRNPANPVTTTSSEASTSAPVQDKEEKKTGKNLEIELPPHALESATILVSQSMCRDCEVFLKRVNHTFHINLTVVVSQVTVDEM